MALATILKKLVRKKVLSQEDVNETNLKRCLTTLDLVGLGIGSTLGAGLYVVAGQVAHDKAGPSVIISFLVAAVASAFAGLCYAEFASRIPRAGSAYVYSYVSVGEFMAFIIGWNLVLEYVIGAASVARGLSGYIDFLIDFRISKAFNSTMPIRVDELSQYPDFFAFGLTILVTIILGFGVKESARLTNIFTVVNLLVVLYITICGLFKLDFHNWNLSEDEVPSYAGSGGFMPHGFSGMMAGAASCFYAFVGFDCVATTGEESKNPQRAIPIAIIVSLIIIFLSYFCVSAVITLMCPYYLIDTNAPLPFVFNRVGWGVAKYFISVGAISGLTTSLVAGMLPLPRVLYAMGTDGVIFKFMGKVSPKFQTPFIGTAISGIFAGLMAMLFNLGELVNMMSIGTLLAYTLVAVSVLILRYDTCDETREEQALLSDGANTFRFKDLFVPQTTQPTSYTSLLTKITILALCIFITIFSAFVIFCDHYIEAKESWAIVLTIVLGLAMVTCLVIIQRQPQSSTELAFKVPLIPYIPALSCLINIYLMLKLSEMTWLRFGIWMVIGLAIYFGYGIRHSSLEDKAGAVPSLQTSALVRNQYHSIQANLVEGRETDVNLYAVEGDDEIIIEANHGFKPQRPNPFSGDPSR